jgi:tetratricopeptide (TPR) repeat protein
MPQAPKRLLLSRHDALLFESLLVPPPPPAPGPDDPAPDFFAVLDRVRRTLPDLAADVQTPPALLLAELLDLPLADRPGVLAARPVLRSPEFLAFVRETGLSALPGKPAFAEALALLAVQQAQESLPVEEARRHLLWAYCVVATVRRLRRLPAQAELVLERASCLVTTGRDRALYLRTLAVLRWEQGRSDEAQALLWRPTRRFREPAPESRVVLGFLHLLEGAAVDHPRALFESACRSLDPAHQTLPALFARLGLALASGRAGDFAAATQERRQAQDLFVLLADDPAALAYPTWLDARIARLTRPGEALAALEIARGELLRHGFPFAATLATVDALLFLALTDQVDRIAPFLAGAPLPLALPPATFFCQALADPPRAPHARSRWKAALRRQAARLPMLLRRVCVLRGAPIEPLPFV